MSEPVIPFEGGVLRPWRDSDLEALLRHADDADVSRALRDRFPFPYGRDDGIAFLASCAESHAEWRFALEVDGAAAGGVGFRPGEDVHAHCAELGYWLGRQYWGRGLVAAALRAALPVAMRALRLYRVSAGVYSNNPRSMRGLEKLGFEREGVQRRAAFKRGELLDVVVYARTRATLESTVAP